MVYRRDSTLSHWGLTWTIMDIHFGRVGRHDNITENHVVDILLVHPCGVQLPPIRRQDPVPDMAVHQVYSRCTRIPSGTVAVLSQRTTFHKPLQAAKEVPLGGTSQCWA
jgi:hypothetical protein